MNIQPTNGAYPPSAWLRLLATVALAVFWTVSCDDEIAPPLDPSVPTTITVTPATAELGAVGATVQLTARVLDQHGQAMADATVTWTSAATEVATVSSSGLVAAVGGGTVAITANAGEASDTAAVTVARDREVLEAFVRLSDR